MTARKRVVVIAGTRPEGIKLAPVVRALRARPERFECTLVSTGQHREMLAQVLEAFELAPDLDLGLMRPGQDLTDVTAGALLGLRGPFRERRPDWVIVQGDTTTAFAAALAAFYEKIPVAHVEAGLRSGQRYAPFPEEVNRRLADQLSELFFAPTEASRRALLAEGFDAAKIEVTGNTVVDALLVAREKVRAAPPPIPGLDEAALEGKRLVLVTGHRRESFGEGFEAICRALLRLVRAHPDVAVVYPVHLNPNVDGPVRRLLGGEPRIQLLRPLAYLPFVSLLARCDLVLSDSGGVQEEAPSFGKPLLVMRDVTERPEGVEAGVARLVGTTEERIVAAASELLSDPAAYAALSRGVNPYGDGRASERIADRLEAEP